MFECMESVNKPSGFSMMNNSQILIRFGPLKSKNFPLSFISTCISLKL